MNKLRLLFGVFYALAIMPAYANPPSDQTQQATDYYLAIKGGISLGSYESGINDVLLTYIHQQEQNNSRLVSFSGASAGSINAILSAIKHCYRDIPNGGLLMKNTWDIGINSLLGDGEDEDSGLFTRTALREKIARVKQVISQYTASKNCELIITMSITRLSPLKVRLKTSKQMISIQRFVVPIKVSAAKGRHLKFENLAVKSADENCRSNINCNRVSQIKPGPYIRLVENSNGTVDFDRVADVALASSAFPVAFQPIEIAHCFNVKYNAVNNVAACKPENAQKALFSDGGLFDNSPVGVVRDLMHVDKSDVLPLFKDKRKKVMFFINPDHYRPLLENIEEHQIRPAQTGLGDYAFHIIDPFDTATSTEFRSALVDFELDKLLSIDTTPLVTTRFHNILADFHSHFGAFYSVDFRNHDYLVGVYDGVIAIAQDICNRKPVMESAFNKCIMNTAYNWIEQKLADNIKEHTSQEFVRYLYNMEFGTDVTLKDPGNNIYIALAEGFKKSSKQNLGDISLFQYARNLQKILYKDSTSIFHQNKPGQSKLKFDENTLEILDNYHKWRSKNYRLAFRNIRILQQNTTLCSDCSNRELNATIGSVVSFSEPTASSIFTYSETGAWPLAYRPFDILSFSLTAGYEFWESSPQYSLLGRIRLRPGLSLEMAYNYRDVLDDKQDDDYESLATGLNYHSNSILLPVVGIGYDYAYKSRQYTSDLGGIYLSLGLLNEIAYLRYLYRPDDITAAQSEFRDRQNISVQFDITKLIDILDKNDYLIP